MRTPDSSSPRTTTGEKKRWRTKSDLAIFLLSSVPSCHNLEAKSQIGQLSPNCRFGQRTPPRAPSPRL